MLDTKLHTQWESWYPKEIFLKDIKNNKKIFFHLNDFTEKDFSTNLQHNRNHCKAQKINPLMIESLKKEAYDLGFKDGLLKDQEKNILLSKKINDLFSDFKVSLSLFEKMLFSRLLKTVLIVSSYVLGKNVNIIDENVLLKSIKKTIDKDNVFLKKIQLLIHPDNKELIKKIFKDSLNTDQCEVLYDSSMDLNSFKVKSDDGQTMDSTVDTRWQELCRLIDSEKLS